MKNKIILLVIFIIFVSICMTELRFVVNNNDSQIYGQGTHTLNSTDEKLKEISFNGIKIGDKIQKEMKNLVMDAHYVYEYDNIHIDVDQDDIISYLGVVSSNVGEVDAFIATKDTDINYQDKKLETISDFKEFFGDGSVKEDYDDYYTIVYNGKYIKLYIDVKDDNIVNVTLKRIN